jgi:hypothetical protein
MAPMFRRSLATSASSCVIEALDATAIWPRRVPPRSV